MKRALSVLGGIVLTLAASPSVGSGEAPRPNVVLILIDDLNHLGVTAYGAKRISEWSGLFRNAEFRTPRIDGLAQEGLRCDNAFVYPLCEPTRIALMSGQLNSRNFLQPKAQHASDITFGDVFQRAGYATGIFGKWKQTRGTREIPGRNYIREFGWDEFCCFDVVGEGQRYINPSLVINGEVRDYQGRRDLDPQTGRRWYGPDICNRHALDFIHRHKDGPFFLYYPMLLVHDPHQPTPGTEPPSAFDDFPEVDPCGGGRATDDRRYFPDMLAYMDKLIGRVIDTLAEHNLREKTLIVVLGDNGTKEPFSHVRPDGSEYPGGKGGNKDNGLHVPLVLSWPGVIPGGTGGTIRSYGGLVDVTDIFPTLCEAAGIAIPNPESIDGISFWPQARGGPGEPRRFIYTWYNGNNPSTDLTNLLRYAFNKDFKRYAPHARFPEGRFFDLRHDPMELSGEREEKVAWVHYHRSGLDPNSLDPEQRAAYEELGRIIEAHRHVPVTGLQITDRSLSLTAGDSMTLGCRITPSGATRQNLLWVSGDPAIATVDKFGTLFALRPGEVKVSVCSWDDARPLACYARETYSRPGITDTIQVQIR